MFKLNIAVVLQLGLIYEAYYRPLMKYCTLLHWWAAAFVATSGCVTRSVMDCFLRHNNVHCEIFTAY